MYATPKAQQKPIIAIASINVVMMMVHVNVYQAIQELIVILVKMDILFLLLLMEKLNVQVTLNMDYNSFTAILVI